MDALIDTRQLRSFLAVARQGSFTLAAKELHLTQSAVSHALRALEEELGCQLLQRKGRGVLLTHQGRELLKHGEAFAKLMLQIRSSIGGLHQNPRGLLRIGCTTAASQFILPAALREFRESFPLYDIRVIPGETPELLERLLRDEIDLSICLKPGASTQITAEPILMDELLWLVSPLHPLVGKKIGAKQASDQTFILSSRQSYTFELVQAHFLQQGIRPRSYIELGSVEAIKELAKLGLGIGVCAAWNASAEMAGQQLVPVTVGRGRIRRQWVVCCLSGRPLRLSERIFMGLCRETGRQIQRRMPEPA